VLQGGLIELPNGGEGEPWSATEYGGRPCELSGECAEQGDVPTWVTPFTSMFMHGSILHIAGNLLFLWIFGNNVEDSMGRLTYLAFYLLGGVAALAAQAATDLSSAIPTIGASGAVSAVLGAYIVIYPRARVITFVFVIFFFTVIELPALIMLGLWFLQQVAFGAYDLNGEGGGIAYFAHIGGFVFGALVIKLLARNVKPVPVRHARY